ncbi:MAG TPA: methyltransferase domain-containing protein [Pyrinomonadaceae bacterium]
MLETGESEIDVDRIMHAIRETVARQRQQVGGENAPPSPGRFPLINTSRLPAQVDSSPLSLQPEFQTRPDNQYHVDDLLKYHGRDFVRNAYRAILRREPDAAGLAQHLESLAGGRFNKIDILASLRSSPEGERAQVKIEGLAWPAAIRRMGRVPLVGYLLQILIAVGRLPLLLRNQRQYEFYHLAQQQQIVDHVNQVHNQLAETIAEKIAGQQQIIASLLHEQQEMAQRHVAFKDEIETHLSVARQQIELLLHEQQKMAERHVESGNAFEARLTAASEHVDQQMAALARQLEEQTQQFLRRQQQTRTELIMQERRLALLLEEAREQPSRVVSQQRSKAFESEEDHLLDALYAAFEEQFRGSREEIKNRLRVYLPILEDAKITEDVLDIGCGRGEWLELLGEEGVRSRGVDHNRVFVEQCKQIGVDVTEEDALVYLRSLPDNSLSAVTSFHLVEHLPFETLVKLLDEIIRTLKSGGLLILETPNPENFIVGSYSFYADPTHRNPIPSPTLQFLLESRGLCDIKVMNLRPFDSARIEGETEIIKRFNEYFCSAPDYGIVGWKV